MSQGEVITPEILSSIFCICLSFFAGGVISWIIFRHFSVRKIKFDLEQKRESLEFVIESGRMGTWEVDLQENKVYCSDYMLRLWNIPSDYDGDRKILHNKVHPDDRQTVIDSLATALASKSIYEFEYRIIPEPGVIKWIISRGRVTYSIDNKPSYLSGIVYDITEKKLKEQADLAIARSRDQFFMIAGHELKTPLTCLHLQLQVHEWELSKSKVPVTFDWAKESLSKQRRHVKRITRIVDNMLDQSKIEEKQLELHREFFDLAQMVKDVIDEFAVTAMNAGVSIKLTRSDKISGHWDKFRLEQVLLNLLINALRYGDKKPIEVDVIMENKNAMIKVRDYGIGIHEKDHQRIFEKFERAVSETNRDGIGLGLYISKNFINAHDGSIQVQSEYGKGAEFTVMLPV